MPVSPLHDQVDRLFQHMLGNVRIRRTRSDVHVNMESGITKLLAGPFEAFRFA